MENVHNEYMSFMQILPEKPFWRSWSLNVVTKNEKNREDIPRMDVREDTVA